MTPSPHTLADVAPLFEGAAGYLSTATFGLPPATALAELEPEIASWRTGRTAVASYDAYVDRSRRAFAHVTGVPESWVATAGQVSSFVGLVAASLPAGARVVGFRGEFTSVIFPFLARRDLDVRLVELDEMVDAVDDNTALIALSAAQSADGALADLAGVRAAAERYGTKVLIDGTQAVGWLPYDASWIDFHVAGTYKWLLSPRGTALMSVRPEHWDWLRPVHANWYAGHEPWGASIYGGPLVLAADARRFDLSPGWLAWVGTAPALELIEELGVETIHAHDVALAARVRSGLGLAETGSAMVSTLLTDVQVAALEAAGVRYAMRDGRARLAFHLYNTDSDAELLLGALGHPAR